MRCVSHVLRPLHYPLTVIGLDVVAPLLRESLVDHVIVEHLQVLDVADVIGIGAHELLRHEHVIEHFIATVVDVTEDQLVSLKLHGHVSHGRTCK